MRSWRRLLHRWDNGTPANAPADHGDGPAASCVAGGSACDGVDAQDGEFDPIMMDEDDDGEAGGWEGGAALDDAIDDD